MEFSKRDPFFLSAAGPCFLAGALLALLLWIAPFMWPFALLAAGGGVLISVAGGTGMLCSFFSLIGVASWQFSLLSSQLWCSLFLASIAVSWWILFLARKERETKWQSFRERIDTLLEQNTEKLTNQKKWETKYQLLQEQVGLQEKSYRDLESSLASCLQELKLAQTTKESLLQEKQLWMDRCEALTGDLAALQTHQKEWEAKKEEGPSKELIEIKRQYCLLHEQFQEKAELLHQTRKELFALEGRSICLQKEQEEAEYALLEQDRSFHAHLESVVQECHALEQEVVELETLVTPLMTVKKPVRARKRVTKKKEALPDLLEKAIEQISLLE